MAFQSKGHFKGRERKTLTEQIQQTEKEISERLDKLSDILSEDGYPDVQALIATYREAETVVEQYNCGLADCEHQMKEKSRPARSHLFAVVRNFFGFFKILSIFFS